MPSPHSQPPAGQQARLLQTHTPELFANAVAEVVEALRKGEVVALPTETVYGLAANAWNPEAVRRIYEAKGRPAHNPIILHVVGKPMALECVAQWADPAERLAAAFWPGPLTLVLPKSARVPEIVTAGGPTVGIRWPSHPFMQAVIQGCGFPLAAPSANRANELSPTHADHVLRSLGDRIPLVVEGGQSQVGIESTVIDLSTPVARLLRPGMIHETALRELLAAPADDGSGNPAESSGPLRSPGQLPRHYAPRARLETWEWKGEADLAARLRRLQPGFRRIHLISHTRVPVGLGEAVHVSVIPHDPEAFARALYAELHRCDEEQADLVVVEAVPPGPEWAGIADRLRRASA